MDCSCAAVTLLLPVPNMSLRWRHNGHDSVSNHQPHDCLLNHLFRRRSKKTSKLWVTGLLCGELNSPHKWPVTWKMFPFDDVITRSGSWWIFDCFWQTVLKNWWGYPRCFRKYILVGLNSSKAGASFSQLVYEFYHQWLFKLKGMGRVNYDPIEISIFWVRQQAVTWIAVYSDSCRHMTSMGLRELKLVLLK